MELPPESEPAAVVMPPVAALPFAVIALAECPLATVTCPPAAVTTPAVCVPWCELDWLMLPSALTMPAVLACPPPAAVGLLTLLTTVPSFRLSARAI